MGYTWYNNIYRRTFNKLTEFPDDIGVDAREINLSNNEIVEIPANINQF